jgi:DNA polymerase sigma
MTIYGSQASNLALPDSDIDLVITLVDIIDTGFAVLVLKEELAVYPWASDVTGIETASVPVVKLTYQSERTSDNTMPINIDITFDLADFPNHTGQSTLLVTKSVLGSNSAVRPLSLVLKYLLNEHNLGNSYKGGLNGYSLVLWIGSLLCQ